jgi:hypothetical protein
MKEAEEQNVEQAQGPKRPRSRGRLWIVLVAVLVVGARFALMILPGLSALRFGFGAERCFV